MTIDDICTEEEANGLAAILVLLEECCDGIADGAWGNCDVDIHLGCNGVDLVSCNDKPPNWYTCAREGCGKWFHLCDKCGEKRIHRLQGYCSEECLSKE